MVEEVFTFEERGFKVLVPPGLDFFFEGGEFEVGGVGVFGKVFFVEGKETVEGFLVDGGRFGEMGGGWGEGAEVGGGGF